MTEEQKQDKSVVRLADEKRKIHEQLITSKADFDELTNKKKMLELSLRKKIIKAREDEIKRRELEERDINIRLIKARNLFRDANYDLSLKECEGVLYLDNDNKDARDLIDRIEQTKQKMQEEEISKKHFKEKRQRIINEVIIESRKHIRKSDYETAITILEECLIKNGSHIELEKILKEAETRLIEKNKEEKETREKEKQLKLEENALIKIASELLNEKRFDKAKETFNRVIKINPLSEKALEGVLEAERMIAFELEESVRKAREQKEYLLKSLAKADCLIAQEDFQEALKLLESLINNSPVDEVEKITKRITEINQETAGRKKEEALLKEKKNREAKEKKKEAELNYLSKFDKIMASDKEDEIPGQIYALKSLLIEYPEKEAELNLLISELESRNNEIKRKKISEQDRLLRMEKEGLDKINVINNLIRMKNFTQASKEIAEARVLFPDLAPSLSECMKNIRRYEEELERAEKKSAEEKKKEEESLRWEKIRNLETVVREHLGSLNFEEARNNLVVINTLIKNKDEYLSIVAPLEELLSGHQQIVMNEKKQTEDSFLSSFSKGMELYKQGNFWNAFLFFKEAKILKPDDKDVNYFINSCTEKLRAEEDQARKQEEELKNAEALYNLLKAKVKSLCVKGDFDQAYAECQNISVNYVDHDNFTNIIELIDEEAKKWHLRKTEEKLRLNDERNKEKAYLSDELFIKGKISAREGKFEEAFAYLYESLRILPDNKKVLSLIDEVENLKLRQEKFLNEKESKNLATEQEVKKLAAQAERYIRNNDYEAALDTYENALDLDPVNEYLINKRQETEETIKDLKAKREKEALRLAEKIDSLTIEASRKFYQEKFIEALGITSEILVLDPENKKVRNLENQIREKKDLEERAEQERVIREKEEISRKKEKDELAYHNRLAEIKSIHHAGLEFYRNSEFERAIEEWEKVKFIDPANAMVNDEIRRAKLKIKEMEIAKLQEEELSKQTESRGNHLWLEGRRYFREGEYSRAIESWEQGILLLGRERRFIEGIEKAQSLMKKKKHEETSKKLLQEKKDKSIQHFTFIANRYLNNGQYREAIKFFEQALLVDPDNINLKNGILHAEESLRASSSGAGNIELNMEISANEQLIDKYGVDEELDSIEKYDTLSDEEIDKTNK